MTSVCVFISCHWYISQSDDAVSRNRSDNEARVEFRQM